MSIDDPGKDRRIATEEAMADPQVGDRFSEMFCHWVYVVGRSARLVEWMSANAPCTFPDDAQYKCGTLQEFRDAYAYKTGTGFWISLEDRGNDVSGWGVL